MEIPRMSIDDLKAVLERQEQILILDTRQPEAYKGSNKKIPGALYLDPNYDDGIREFSRGLDKSRTVVAYCT